MNGTDVILVLTGVNTGLTILNIMLMRLNQELARRLEK